MRISYDHDPVESISLSLHHHLQEETRDQFAQARKCLHFLSVSINNRFPTRSFYRRRWINGHRPISLTLLDRSHVLNTFTRNGKTEEKKTNKKLVNVTPAANPSPSGSRMKSLIKPPIPRSSWELLLDDYLKSDLTPNLSPNISPSIHTFAPLSPSRSVTPSPNPQHIFVPSPRYEYPFGLPQRTEATDWPVPPRRYQIPLDEMVYLISQVGRADLYREMVQYINTQPLSSTAKTTSSTLARNLSTNSNAYSTARSDESASFDKKTRRADAACEQLHCEFVSRRNRSKTNRHSK